MGSVVSRCRDSSPPTRVTSACRTVRLANVARTLRYSPKYANTMLGGETASAKLGAAAEKGGSREEPPLPSSADMTKRNTSEKTVAPPPVPVSSCLVPSKHIPNPKKVSGWVPSPPSNEKEDATKNGQVSHSQQTALSENVGSPAGPNMTDKCITANSTECKSPKQDISGKSSSMAPTLSDTAVAHRDYKNSLECAEESPSSNASPQPKKGASQTQVVNLLDAHQSDGRVPQDFMEYIVQHAMHLRNAHVVWFNVDNNRKMLTRREHRAVVWNPLEEIAVTEAEEKPLKEAAEEVPVAPFVEKKRQPSPAPQKQKRPQSQPQPQPQSQQKAIENPPRPRTRPILPEDVPHRMQLAKKALEDNAFFIYSRKPRLY
ncbi:hypothetical protein TraAM80_04109 [Trypanosoma rangeli]|uniref:Uncharacterized protein n=1 Tax=Trypanosoma rangeli TaxID=5698 RepID=A0A422NKX3_TRYRA|nr:uncharacterized protein TraAM80_04109 [Trypanosoma rangeli]RNF06113.1 hypothetical protein TraAM80_04109 [Trypanosoma rangeli]|eukprot:RNF06113.1 hypothetical protein TraAM80_04109 [Trypanosoma rangeli]